MLYFHNSDDFCHDLEYWQNYMSENGLYQINLNKAIPEKIKSGFFYCNIYNDCGDMKYKTCGNQCDYYRPRNGKSGVCRDWRKVYDKGEKIILKNKQNETRRNS